MARASRPLARSAGTRRENETIVIVCEGKKTERIYFDGIRTSYRLATTTVNVVGLGADPLTVVEKAIELKPGHDHAWAVFDVEAAGPHARSHPTLRAAIERAESAGIRWAITHPCFELWLILHFESHTAYLNNGAARAKIRKLPCDYDDKGFDFAKVWSRHQDATRRATDLDRRQRAAFEKVEDRNPWTNVHELLATLLAIIPDDPAGS